MIIHIDGDAFFASCEVSLNQKLKGKPVVVGLEKGIVSAMTYEAKARGISRGLRIFEVRKICPEAIILPSDYKTYSIFSHRMFAIVRRYSSKVEEYSIDECFASVPDNSCLDIAKSIKKDLESDLGMTFSVGVAPTKVLAKIASKFNKPSGLVFVDMKRIEDFLSKNSIDRVWGIGRHMSVYLRSKGIVTAADLFCRNLSWINENLDKPAREIWYELHGISVNLVGHGSVEKHKSIMKTCTFKPPSSDRDFVFSQLSKNVESACLKARLHGLFASEASFFLKTQDFLYDGLEMIFPCPVNTPQMILEEINLRFDEIYHIGVLYRATGITLRKISRAGFYQQGMFGDIVLKDRLSEVYKKVDSLNHKYAEHSVFLASSMMALHSKSYVVKNTFKSAKLEKLAIFRSEIEHRGQNIPGKRKRLEIPTIGDVY